ncbi:MAG: FMN-binding negative transcriptional regulator [Rhodospirillaceae bacterium]|nr:FMN-binding negative transcriptional regulator [Rhodospirillaceae bacterium]
MTELFQADDAALAELIAQHPLAWIVAKSAPESAALMPMLLETDAAGRPVALLGHLPKAHPIVGALTQTPRALFLFLGPNAYISPEWLSNKDWGPTWNFATAQITADIAFDDALTDEALSKLVAHMEKGRPSPWTIDSLGPRYESLRGRVIGFRATIKQVSPRFKLGQDEKPTVFAEILRGLGDHPLARWMRRFAGK